MIMLPPIDSTCDGASTFAEGARLRRYSPSDADCLGGSGDGPAWVDNVTVVGQDVFELDVDGDGIGCESQ